MKSSVAVLLMSSLALASALVTLILQGDRVVLKEVVVNGTEVPLSGLGVNVANGSLALEDKLMAEEGRVKELFKASSELLLKNSLIKRGQAKVVFSILNDPKVAELSARVRGSALIALFFVRNMDVVVKSYINKEEGYGNLTLSGFVELPAPKVTVQNLLKATIPKIEKQIEEMGLELVKLEYEVSGRKMPPVSKVTFEATVRGTKEKILNYVNGLGFAPSNMLNLFNLTDNVVRKIDGEALLTAKLKKIDNELMTLFTLKVSATGIYTNTTTYEEIKRRTEVLLRPLNATDLAQYLLPSDEFMMKLTLVASDRVRMNATLQGIAFKNVPEFWTLLKKIGESGNIHFKILCDGKVVALEDVAACG
ncbi:MAG: hypothetical protein GXO07_03835 [Crenarchaeota archaeon]|nr:hypothetical protein [Thermoproteota archaeon]